MGAQTTSSTTDGQTPTRAGRGRGALLAVLTAALFSLSAGAAAASPVVTPPSPQHLHLEVSAGQDVTGQACGGLDAVTTGLPVAAGALDVACRNVNGWQ
jgi:hypothetical protein